jgi:hypothetical protein
LADYPNTQGYNYTFGRGEISLNGQIYAAISGVDIEQATEVEALKGMRVYPLGMSEGTMDIGEGTVTFSDEGERMDFIDALGDGYRNVMWTLTYTIRSVSGGEHTITCEGCRVTNNPISHEEGAGSLGGEVQFAFVRHLINGKSPHGS